MGRLVLALVLAGCASHAASGPAWPKPSPTDTDGGESIAPHVVRSAEATVDKSDDDDKPAPAPAAAPAAKDAPATKDAPAATPGAPAPPAVEEPTTVEDIVIEIDD
ncbi:MAG: hypothetical protein ACM31C_11065 [Acidobacteriota bacterium]